MNPRVVMTEMAASTCVVGLLISLHHPKTDTLVRQPAPWFLPSRQEHDATASPLIDRIRRPRALRRIPWSHLGGHGDRTGGEADAASNCVIGSYGFAHIFTRPSERPRHATVTQANRSIPVAPKWGPQVGFPLTVRPF